MPSRLRLRFLARDITDCKEVQADRILANYKLSKEWSSAFP